MVVVSNLLASLAGLLAFAARAFEIVIFGHVVCSWVGADPFNPIVRILWKLSDPVLRRVRAIVPPIANLDLSPLIVLLVLEYGVIRFLVATLYDLAR